MHAHGQTGRPARVVDKCIRLREGRIGEDKVLDMVEESLIMEMENVRLWQMRLKTAIEQVGVWGKGYVFQSGADLVKVRAKRCMN